MPNQPQTTNLIAKALAKVCTVRPPTLPVSNLQRHTFTITARRQVFRMLFSGASQNSSPPASASVGGIFISLLFPVTSLASPGMAAAVRTDTRNIYCRCAQHSTQKPALVQRQRPHYHRDSKKFVQVWRTAHGTRSGNPAAPTAQLFPQHTAVLERNDFNFNRTEKTANRTNFRMPASELRFPENNTDYLDFPIAVYHFRFGLF